MGITEHDREWKFSNVQRSLNLLDKSCKDIVGAPPEVGQHKAPKIMLFHEAVVHMKQGSQVKRRSWPDDRYLTQDPFLIKSLRKEGQVRPEVTEWNGTMMGQYKPDVVDVLARDWTFDREKCMQFGKALEKLKVGQRMTRAGWDSKDTYVELEVSNKALPYIYMRTATEDSVPWVISQIDVLTNDWEEVDS